MPDPTRAGYRDGYAGADRHGGVTAVSNDDLGGVREALVRQDWGAAFASAQAAATTSAADEAELSDLLAEAAWWLGRLDDCIEAREQAFHAFGELGEHRRAGQCAVWLYEHHLHKGRRVIAATWLRRARRTLLDDHLCTAYGALLLREAEVAHGAGELDVALALAEETVLLAETLSSADLEAEALQTRGRVRIDQGDVRGGMADLDDAMLPAVAGRLRPYSTGKVYCSLVSACEQIGDLRRANEWTEATMAWAERHPFTIFPGICRIHRAVVLKHRGDLADAENEAIRACDELLHTHAGNSAAAWAEVGDICRRLGELDRAQDAFERSRELSGQPCGELAMLRLAQGRLDAAQAIVGDCLGRARPLSIGRAGMLAIAVQVHTAADDLDAGATASAELDEIAALFGTPMLAATSAAARGRVLLATGENHGAIAALQSSVDAWLSLDLPYEVATTRTLLGQAYRQAGDDVKAAASFAGAVEVFDRIGARFDAGAVTNDTRVVLPAGLTHREVEVLGLVAAGLTNNEIAASLFLSAKTVSRHLSNIFTKIDVSSRAAATAFAFEHDLVDSHRGA